MDAAARSRLVGWLFLLGPAASLLLGIGFLRIVEVTNVWGALPAPLRNVSPGPWAGGSIFFPTWSMMVLGWLLLTLGCSIGTCLRFLRRRGNEGAELTIYTILLSPLLALAHIALLGGIAFAGCLLVFSSQY